MRYLESKKLKDKVNWYKGTEGSISWILRDPFIYNYFNRLDRSAKILDIGCGRGYFLDELDAMGFKNISCVDLVNFLQLYLKFGTSSK